MGDAEQVETLAAPTHHRHEGDDYGVISGPAHTCRSPMRAESVYVLTREDLADLIARERAEAYQMGARDALTDAAADARWMPADPGKAARWLRDRAATYTGSTDV